MKIAKEKNLILIRLEDGEEVNLLIIKGRENTKKILILWRGNLFPCRAILVEMKTTKS